MKFVTTGKMAYQLRLDDGHFAGSLLYTQEAFQQAEIRTQTSYHLEKAGAGQWIIRESGQEYILSSCHVELDGRIRLQTMDASYQLVKPLNWKTRFSLINEEDEEIAAFLPTLNWETEGFDFSLQLNDEFINETEAFLILQALHCAVCGMAMLNGLLTPTIGNLKG